MREPALLFGVAASIAVAILLSISGSGLVDGKGLVLVNLLSTLIPTIAAIVTRAFVTPTSAPVLPIGTSVTTPKGAVAVVSGASTNPVSEGRD